MDLWLDIVAADGTALPPGSVTRAIWHPQRNELAFSVSSVLAPPTRVPIGPSREPTAAPAIAPLLSNDSRFFAINAMLLRIA